MSSNIELSLDDIIKMNKSKNKKGGAARNPRGSKGAKPGKSGKRVKHGRIAKNKPEQGERAHPLDRLAEDDASQQKQNHTGKKPMKRASGAGAGAGGSGSVQQRLSALKNRLKQNRGGPKRGGFKPRFRK